MLGYDSWWWHPWMPLALLLTFLSLPRKESLKVLDCDLVQKNYRSPFVKNLLDLIQIQPEPLDKISYLTRLLHPQHSDVIWLGLTPYRLPLDILSKYPEPWSWKISGSERERGLASFSVLKKTESQTWERNGVQELLDWVFLTPFLPHDCNPFFMGHGGPPCLGLFFQSNEIGKSSLFHFLKFLRTRVLDTH